MNEYNIVMPFIDQSESFTYGFECGQIYSKMEMGHKFENYMFHSCNLDQVKLMCKRFQYKFETLISNELGSEWMYLNAEVDLSKSN